jgi:hypothetical protein
MGITKIEEEGEKVESLFEGVRADGILKTAQAEIRAHDHRKRRDELRPLEVPKAMAEEAEALRNKYLDGKPISKVYEEVKQLPNVRTWALNLGDEYKGGGRIWSTYDLAVEYLSKIFREQGPVSGYCVRDVCNFKTDCL